MKRRGVDESNLATVPLAILHGRAGDLSDDLVRFTQPIRYGDAQVTRTWEIAATKGQSLPIAADEDILVALQTLTSRQGWPRELRFSYWQVLRVLERKERDKCRKFGGKEYRRVKEGIQRLANLNVSTDYWWSERIGNFKKGYQSYKIISSVKLVDGTDAQEHETNWLEWGADYHRSMIETHRTLDLTLYLRLTRETSRKLFRLLNALRPDPDGRLRFPVRTLCTEFLGICRNAKYTSEFLRVLEPALEEVRGVGGLASWDLFDDGDIEIVPANGAAGRGAPMLDAALAASPAPTPDESAERREFVVEALRARGLKGPEVTKNLVPRCMALDDFELRLAWFDLEKAAGWMKNPPAVLRTTLLNDFEWSGDVPADSSSSPATPDGAGAAESVAYLRSLLDAYRKSAPDVRARVEERLSTRKPAERAALESLVETYCLQLDPAFATRGEPERERSRDELRRALVWRQLNSSGREAKPT